LSDYHKSTLNWSAGIPVREPVKRSAKGRKTRLRFQITFQQSK
jgi:hypothetical protein